MLNELIYNPLNVTLFFVLNFLNILVGNKIIIKLLKNDVEKINETKLLIIQGILTSFAKLFQFNLYRIINIAIDLLLYNKILKLKSEKLYLSIIFNLIITTISESIIVANLNLILVGLTELAIKTIIYIIIRFSNLKIDFKETLNEKQKLKIDIISFISILIIIFSKIKIMNDFNKISIYVYLLINLFIVAYLTILVKCILLSLSKESAIEEIENLEGSNKRLQENYDDVRAFKHDFNNIIQGIGGYIVAKDMDGLEKMYKSISKECQQINNKQSINSEIINNPAILNLINNKIKLAEQSGVELRVQVYIDLNSLNVSSYDLCRMLGILLDNAIEASYGCDEKIITIKFLKDKFNNRNLIIIENPYKNYLIDVKKIYQKGFSSKKDKVSHGLGLWKIKQILKKNKNLQIYTSRGKLFKQQLEIY